MAELEVEFGAVVLPGNADGAFGGGNYALSLREGADHGSDGEAFETRFDGTDAENEGAGDGVENGTPGVTEATCSAETFSADSGFPKAGGAGGEHSAKDVANITEDIVGVFFTLGEKGL